MPELVNVTTSRWKTKDGSMFDTSMEATQHENMIRFIELFKRTDGLCNGIISDDYIEILWQFLIARKEKIVPLLGSINEEARSPQSIVNDCHKLAYRLGVLDGWRLPQNDHEADTPYWRQACLAMSHLNGEDARTAWLELEAAHE